MSDTKAIAAQLNNIEYPVRINPSIVTAAKHSGIVIVHGASDDLMEFCGAIEDEVSCYGGGTAYLTAAGLLVNECEDPCVYFGRLRNKAAKIEAQWCTEEPYSWTYFTTIPHETFDVMEDGEKYCRGIVFRLSDVKVSG